MGLRFGTSGANSSPKPTNIARLAALACFTTVAASSLATPANASYIIDIVQSGANVDVTGSGSINTAALLDYGSADFVADIHASSAEVIVAPGSLIFWYTGESSNETFGTGGYFGASSSTGSIGGVEGGNLVILPEDYVSGTTISGSSVYDNITLAALGLTAGTYVMTWGSGATADSATVQVGQASTPIPEPPSAPLMLVPALALIAGCQRLRKKAVLF
jgi:hypothetical protein